METPPGEIGFSVGDQARVLNDAVTHLRKEADELRAALTQAKQAACDAFGKVEEAERLAKEGRQNIFDTVAVIDRALHKEPDHAE